MINMNMPERISILIILIAFSGCIRETYDLDRLSKEAHLSPTWVVPVIKGDVSLSDLTEPNDTLIFEKDNFVRLIFREDSFIDLKMEDYYDLNNMISFSESYQLGRLNLTSFTDDLTYTLESITLRLNPAVRAQFVSLNGTTSRFPAFPVTLLQEGTYLPFSNFEYATFDEGFIDIRVRNNLTAPVENISVTLFNTAGHIPVGNTVNISVINPGQTGVASIDLANSTLLNSLTAAVTISSPGTITPVPIDLYGSNIEIAVAARDLWVRSGSIVVHPQIISGPEDVETDTIEFKPGSGIEISLISMKAGDISYSIRSNTKLSSDVSLTLPTALQNGAPITENITVDPDASASGNFPVGNSVFDLGTISAQPYNMIPVEHEILVSSNDRIVNFSSLDEVQIDLNLFNPDFDYVKGYFGQKLETFGPATIDPGISDIINKITGGLLFSNPSVIVNYSNSFSIPVEVDIKATGFKADETTELGFDLIELNYPAAPDERDISGSFLFDKSNSLLPALISMPPHRLVFRGTARMNPQGKTGRYDNYIFGNSRMTGSLDVNIPLELRMNNLQFTDTVDNFLNMDDADRENPVDPDDFEFMKIYIHAENGFPAGISVSLMLYDSEARVNRSTIEAKEVLKPAPVDNSGRVTAPAESDATIEITREFWDSVDQSDSMIFKFTMNTTGNGSKDVKIYSDYRINFTAGMVVKPDLKIKFD